MATKKRRKRKPLGSSSAVHVTEEEKGYAGAVRFADRVLHLGVTDPATGRHRCVSMLNDLAQANFFLGNAAAHHISAGVGLKPHKKGGKEPRSDDEAIKKVEDARDFFENVCVVRRGPKA